MLFYYFLCSITFYSTYKEKWKIVNYIKIFLLSCNPQFWGVFNFFTVKGSILNYFFTFYGIISKYLIYFAAIFTFTVKLFSSFPYLTLKLCELLKLSSSDKRFPTLFWIEISTFVFF